MATSTWVSDPLHSEIGFRIKHLMITSVKGKFSSYEAKATTEDDDFSTAQVSFSADVDSIDTSNADRDGHLKSPEFFDAANHPKITFTSTGMSRKSDDAFTLTGDLSIRGVTNPVTLDVEFGGIVKDPYGQTKAGFSVEGKISRAEFGLTWSALTEAGGVVLGDDVRILCEVQLIKQAS